jgi:hypothetical protein
MGAAVTDVVLGVLFGLTVVGCLLLIAIGAGPGYALGVGAGWRDSRAAHFSEAWCLYRGGEYRQAKCYERSRELKVAVPEGVK